MPFLMIVPALIFFFIFVSPKFEIYHPKNGDGNWMEAQKPAYGNQSVERWEILSKPITQRGK